MMLQFALEKDVFARALMTFSSSDDAARLLLFAVWRAQESISTIRNNALSYALCVRHQRDARRLRLRQFLCHATPAAIMQGCIFRNVMLC